METAEKTEKTEVLKPKKVTFIGQIFTAIWIIGWCAYKFLSSKIIEVTDVIYSALGITACFSPVYFSIMLDKIKDIKFGGEK